MNIHLTVLTLLYADKHGYTKRIVFWTCHCECARNWCHDFWKLLAFNSPFLTFKMPINHIQDFHFPDPSLTTASIISLNHLLLYMIDWACDSEGEYKKYVWKFGRKPLAKQLLRTQRWRLDENTKTVYKEADFSSVDQIELVQHYAQWQILF
jgi:hypothetical protein